MGRYYSGMIEGKFWFGIQSSVAADRFGVSYNEPSYVEYYYSEDDLQGVEDEIQAIRDTLVNKEFILDKFFSEVGGYTDKDITDLGVSMKELSEYADLKLGIKIRDCIKENGYCSFDAEL
jgi:hypothetical protein